MRAAVEDSNPLVRIHRVELVRPWQKHDEQASTRSTILAWLSFSGLTQLLGSPILRSERLPSAA